MSVIINPYSDELARRFETEEKRLRVILGNDVSIEHVGSSAVGIGGKNIVDILIGVKGAEEMDSTRDKLVKNGYYEGNDSHEDRIFMASRKEETGEGDCHIHICLIGSEVYSDFLRLRDYLRANPEIAKEYLEMKQLFAERAGFDRKKYKALKSEYVAGLLKKARK